MAPGVRSQGEAGCCSVTCPENGNWPPIEEVTVLQEDGSLLLAIRVLLNLVGEFLTRWRFGLVSLVVAFPENLAAVR